jgi:hypothetical protein
MKKFTLFFLLDLIVLATTGFATEYPGSDESETQYTTSFSW